MNMQKYKDYLEFEHTLRYFLYERKADKVDYFHLNNIKHALIVFLMKDEFKETNEIFLSNMRTDIYNSIEYFSSKHVDLNSELKKIKQFIEKYIITEER